VFGMHKFRTVDKRPNSRESIGRGYFHVSTKKQARHLAAQGHLELPAY